MKNLLFLALMFLLCFHVIAQHKMPGFYFYVSSKDPDHDAGIALFHLDTASGQLTFLQEFNQVESSSYLAISENGESLYSVTQPAGKAEGEITSFSILDGGKALEVINRRSSKGNNPCYVSLSNDGNFLLTANYNQGNISTFSVEYGGLLGGNISNIYHSGFSVNKERQQSPHPHMILPAPEGNIVVVPDLGTDRIMIYELREGKLAPAMQPYVSVERGAGPRHFVFHPNLKFGYVVNELNATVTGFTFDKQTGAMDKINTVSILPEGFSGINKAADIHITPDGSYIYASNRGHNSLCVLKVDQETGKAKYLFNENCGGEWPRAFAIDPSGKFILAANMNTGNIVSFKIDYSTGNLQKIAENDRFPGPRCIKFLPKK